MTNLEDIHEGDRVRIEKGPEAHEGIVTIDDRHPRVGGYGLEYRVANGWTVTVLEKAAPPLPTEPGHYLDKDGDHWELPSVGELDPYYAPYARLEPVPVTVQKVIDYLVSECASDWLIEVVREHFGVTS